MIQISFLIVCFLSLILFHLGTTKNKKAFSIFCIWQIIMVIISSAGIFQRHPLFFPIAIFLTVLLTIYLYTESCKNQLNSKMLLWIHVLRIPIELILYQLFLQKKIPQLMTFDGWNFDIFMGISALLAMVYLKVIKKEIPSRVFIAWNLTGLIFLCFIVSLALLSSPLPIQLMAFEQPNVAVLEFPYSLLPTCIVPIVFISNILLIKQTREKQL